MDSTQIKFHIDATGSGAFVYSPDGKEQGKMVIGIQGNVLTAYHTEVAEEMQGKGIAKLLFDAMIAYVRAHNLKLDPRCSYVSAQIKRHAEEYRDIYF